MFKSIPDAVLHDLRERYEEYTFTGLTTATKFAISRGLIMRCVYAFREVNPGISFYPVMAEKDNHKFLAIAVVSPDDQVEFEIPSRFERGKYNNHIKERGLRYNPAANYREGAFFVKLLNL